MTATTIFIVEDELSIAQAVEFALAAEGFSTQIFALGGDCLTALATTEPALILLDVGLADGSGFNFFRQIRQLTEAPIIYTTARSEEIDRVAGLEMGAEDYIVKPFSLRELVARVRVVLRRENKNQYSTTNATQKEISHGAFKLDHPRKQILYLATLLNLTLHEYRLLETLLSHPERVFSRSQLLENGWEAPDHRLERTIDSHIKSLRSKLREVAPDKNPIVTHRGLGYSLVIDP